MWHKFIPRLSRFSTAVLTAGDAGGYPFSLRCAPQPDDARQVLRIQLPAGVSLRPGPACLLYHTHNEQLWDLKSLQILGRLEPGDQEWLLHPERYTPGNGFVSPLDQVRQLFKSQAAAKQYLEKRGIPRPQIRWQEFNEVKAEAKSSR